MPSYSSPPQRPTTRESLEKDIADLTGRRRRIEGEIEDLRSLRAYQINKIDEAIRDLQKRWDETETKIGQLILILNAAHKEFGAYASTKPTLKNANFFKAAMSVEKHLKKVAPKGAKQDELRRAVQNFLPNLNDNTFRSYLSRLKKNNVIQKNEDGLWHLAKNAEANGR